MPRYYCDYCDTYLTHDSPSVRKQHNAGYKHKANVRIYYQQFEEQQTQQIIDQRIKEHLGQAASFQQVGAAYNQHMMAQRPGVPLLPTSMMPNMRGPPLPINPALMRPPVLPRPGVPGYMPGPPMAPMMAPPGAPTPGQLNGLQGHHQGTAPTGVPGSSAPPTSGAPSMVGQPMYQNPPPPPSGGSNNFNLNSQLAEANH